MGRSAGGVRGFRPAWSGGEKPVVLKGRFGVFPNFRAARCVQTGGRAWHDETRILVKAALGGYSACVVFVPWRGGARYSKNLPLSEGGG